MRLGLLNAPWEMLQMLRGESFFRHVVSWALLGKDAIYLKNKRRIIYSIVAINIGPQRVKNGARVVRLKYCQIAGQ